MKNDWWVYAKLNYEVLKKFKIRKFKTFISYLFFE